MAAEQAKEEERQREEVAAVVARLVSCVVTGSVPNLRRVGEAKASRMGMRDLADRLAENGRAPLRGGAHAIDRVLDVRKVGRSLQVLVRWRGEHDDQWRTWAQCNAPAREEATAMARRKFAPSKNKQAVEGPTRPTRDRVHLRRGQVEAPHPKRSRLRKADGRPISAGPVPITPILPSYSPGAAQEPAAYGAGAGRSARGLPILWESPAAEDLRGVLWKASPRGVARPKGPYKRQGSPLVAEGARRARGEGRRDGSSLSGNKRARDEEVIADGEGGRRKREGDITR